MLLARVTAALALCTTLACKPALPSGKLACTTSLDCPPKFVCEANDAGQMVCMSHAHAHDAGSVGDAGGTSVVDASSTDAGSTTPLVDAGNAEHDAGAMLIDAGPADSGPMVPPPPSCHPDAPNEQMGIFVSPPPAGSSVNNCGTSKVPCDTIKLGVDRAVATGRPVVYLDAGKYTEKVTLAAGVTLQGGWDNLAGVWSRHCGANPERIAEISSSDDRAVEAEYDGKAEIDTLTIHTLGPATPGQTLYGVFARGDKTTLKLDHVRVEAADGGNGNTGNMGTTPAAPTGVCAAGDSSTPSAVGADGTASGPGSFSMNGYVPGAGGDGKSGVAGGNGSVGAVQTCVNGGTCAASGNVCSGTATAPVTYSTPGPAGCGGQPASGGTAGLGGGASIALFVWDAHVDVESCVLISGNAGTGGMGGSGAPGGSGGLGGQEGPSTCNICQWEGGIIFQPIQSFNASLPPSAAPIQVEGAGQALIGPIIPIQPLRHCAMETAAVVRGGSGGNGAKSGRGGDGAGGSSYAIYQGGAAAITRNDSALTHGAAGMSTNGAAAGDAADVGGDTTP